MGWRRRYPRWKRSLGSRGCERQREGRQRLNFGGLFLCPWICYRDGFDLGGVGLAAVKGEQQGFSTGVYSIISTRASLGA